MQPVFIVGAHKSGTSLLRSLFDNHPKVFSIPFETHLMQMTGRWLYYPINKNPPSSSSLEEIKNNLIQHTNLINNVKNDIMGGIGNVNLYHKINIEMLKLFMDKEEYSDLAQLIKTFFQGLYFAIYGEYIPEEKKFIIEKTVGQFEYAVELKIIFPSAKFIHIVRNPYSNIVSLRRYRQYISGHYPVLFPYIDGLEYTFYMLQRNRHLIGSDYKVIKYEELVSEPKKIMVEICKFLGMEFTDDLLQPTALGISWKGNSSRIEEFKGISTSTLDKWREEIRPIEIEAINKVISFVLQDYQYEQLPNRKGVWKRNPKEPFKVYIANRFMMMLRREIEKRKKKKKKLNL